MEIIYRASDGKEFNDKKQCKLYEKNLEQIKGNTDVKNYKNKSIVSSKKGDLIKNNKKSKKKDQDIKDWLDNYLCTDDDHDDPDWMFFIGEYLFREEKKYQEAIYYYQKVIELNDEDSSYCMFQIGACKYFLGEYQEAIDNYKTAIELKYEDPSSCNKSIEICRKLLELDCK